MRVSNSIKAFSTVNQFHLQGSMRLLAVFVPTYEHSLWNAYISYCNQKCFPSTKINIMIQEQHSYACSAYYANKILMGIDMYFAGNSRTYKCSKNCLDKYTVVTNDAVFTCILFRAVSSHEAILRLLRFNYLFRF